MTDKKLCLLLLPFLAAAGPCQPNDDELTANEAKLALEEVSLAAEAT